MSDSTHDRSTSLYRFWNDSDELLYVGITHRGWRRFNEHASAKAWWHLVHTVTVDHYPNRETARAAELTAIQSERPRFNIADTGRTGSVRPELRSFACVDGGMVCRITDRRGGHVRTEPLVVDYEVECSAMSDDWLPDEIDAFDLFDMWFDRYYAKFNGVAPVYWFVAGRSVFESATQQWGTHWGEHFYAPEEVATGRTVPLAALPVRQAHWCSKSADKGGFIAEATRWTPQPFTSTVDMGMLMDLARFHHGAGCGR